jgi:hypothetical protein
MRWIATERDAAEAWGEESEMHLWAREWLRPAPSGPVTHTRGDELAAWSGPMDRAVRIANLLWPARELAGLHALEVSYDPQRSPVLRCAIDGEAVPLEQGADGIWRPRRTGGGG